MSVAGCRNRQGVKVKIFKIGPIYNMLSKFRDSPWRIDRNVTEYPLVKTGEYDIQVIFPIFKTVQVPKK